MKLRSLLSLAAGAAILLSASASMAAAPARTEGGILVDSAGMTLYLFDKDPAGGGKSVCNGPCAGIWPALKAGASDSASGDWSIVKRDDGARQWAYKGKPLYLWVNDKKPGDKTGDGYNKVWHVVKP